MLGRQNRLQEDLFVACSLSDLIPNDHILKQVDRVLDLSWLREETEDLYCLNNGRPGIAPEAAVGLMLAGFFHGIVHDRKLIREAQVNLAIRWFAGYPLHEALPHHSSLTRIRQRWGVTRFKKIFQRIVQACVEAGLVGGDTVHIDATLIRADASWDSFVQQHTDQVLQANIEGGAAPLRPPKPLCGNDRVSRKARRSTTDPEAMLAKSNRKQKAEPSYKQHTAVDSRHGILVDVTATPGDVNEGDLIMDQLDQIEINTGKKVKQVTADSGYAYGKIYRGLESKGVEAVIPAKKEPRFGTRIPIRRFKYDGKNHVVKCPKGKTLHRSTRTRHGWFYRSKSADCRQCPLRSECLSPKVDCRTIVISDGYESLLRARRRRGRWSTQWATIYRRHRWRAEGAHAEAKNHHGLRRSVRRGLDNVAIQVYLTACVMNLKRLAVLLIYCVVLKTSIIHTGGFGMSRQYH